MKPSARLLPVLAAAVAALAATGAVAAGPSRSSGPSAFGYHKVRSGIPSGTPRFTLTSPDVADGQPFPDSAMAGSFGCTGGDQAPRLSWSGAPAGTRGYAVTMFDLDAPTGSGFWHWLVWDLPASATSLTGQPPAGAVTGTNDARLAGYLGPCPPAGDRPHRYQITVLALDTPTLGMPATASPAYASFAMGGHVLGYARITPTAQTPVS